MVHPWYPVVSFSTDEASTEASSSCSSLSEAVLVSEASLAVEAPTRCLISVTGRSKGFPRSERLSITEHLLACTCLVEGGTASALEASCCLLAACETSVVAASNASNATETNSSSNSTKAESSLDVFLCRFCLERGSEGGCHKGGDTEDDLCR